LLAGDPLKKDELSKIQIALISACCFVLVGLISYLLRDFSRQLLGIPITTMLRIIGLFLESTPQVLCWAWLLFMLGVVVYRSLSGRKKEIGRQTSGFLPAEPRERVAPLSMRVYNAVRGNRFAWLILGEQLGELTIKVLSHLQRVQGLNVRRMITNHEIQDVPEDVLRCIEMRFKPDYFIQVDSWSRMKQFIVDFWEYVWKKDQSRNPWFSYQRKQAQIMRVLDYLESQLGVEKQE
jgi:hypothetical protein